MKKNMKENNTKTTLREKIRYGFDNLMARGMSAQAGMLFLVTMVVTIIFGSVVYFVYPQLVDTIYLGIWTTFMHMIDGGAITGDHGGFLYMLVMLVVTLIGLVVTATLISIINESLSGKMEKLRKGNSRVLEKDHTIILGFSEGIYTIIENLMIANENVKKGVIVIMDEIKSKAEMEDEISKWIALKKKDDREKNIYSARKYKTKIICRNGDIANKKAVSMCSPETAKSIIVNCADDFMTVKAILAAAGNLNAQTKAGIVAEVTDEDYKKTAMLAGKIGADDGRIHVVYADDFVSRVIAHTGRQPGISKVLTEFLGFAGKDIYIEDVPEILQPKDNKEYTIYEANLSCNDAVILGYKRKKEDGYEFTLNPEPGDTIKKDDKLIVLEEDDGVFKKNLTSVVVEKVLKETTNHEEQKIYKETVIFGYSTKIEKIIKESKNYLSEDSTFTVLLDNDDKNENPITTKDKYKQKLIKEIEELEGVKKVEFLDLYKGDKYKEYLNTEKGVDSVLILSDYDVEPEVNDAHVLGLLLRVREYNKTNKKPYTITTEMIKSENKELAIVKETKDFIVSEDITNKIITQISEQADLYMVFEELLQEKGSEIYMHKFSDYLKGYKENQDIKYMSVVKLAAAKKHTLLGYRDDETGECHICPPKNGSIKYKANNSFIVLG